MYRLIDLRVKNHQKTRFCWLLALVLVCASVFSLAHMASHGFAKHDHHGHACSIHTHCQQAKHSSVAHGFSLELLKVVAPQAPQILATALLQDAPRFTEARAPPISV